MRFGSGLAGWTARGLAILAAGALSLAPSGATSGAASAGAQDRTPLGAWLTGDGDGVIAIAPCGAALCGRIVGMRRDPGTPAPEDWRGRPQCGLTILRDEKPTGDGAWLGTITDPRNGTTWHARLWLDRAGNLNVRGYLGIPLLGQTQVWRRYAGRLTSGCGLLPPAAVSPPTRAHPKSQ